MSQLTKEFFDWYRTESTKTNHYPIDKMLDAILIGIAEEIYEYRLAVNIPDMGSEMADFGWYIAEGMNLLGMETPGHFLPQDIRLDKCGKRACSLIKKFIRGDFNYMERVEMTTKLLDDCYYLLSKYNGIEGHLKRNVEKLRERAATDTIKGSGETIEERKQ